MSIVPRCFGAIIYAIISAIFYYYAIFEMNICDKTPMIQFLLICINLTGLILFLTN